MERISIIMRTTKSEGQIPLRFRLRDGRMVDMYHKSEIVADIKDLKNFDLSSARLKPRISVYNRRLEQDIGSELAIMSAAYHKMRDEGRVFDTQTFEDTITEIKYPKKEETFTFIERFEQFIQDGLRDNLFEKSRAAKYHVLLNMIKRFLFINHKLKIQVKQIDVNWLMNFREFCKNEYQCTSQWKSLYQSMRVQDIPKQARAHNTIAGYMVMLQTFFSELLNQDEIEKSPFPKLGKERTRKIMREKYGEPIYLTNCELEQIMNTSVPPTLETTKKAFLLQCALGCRISDFSVLKNENISVTEDGIPFIHYSPIKTRSQTYGQEEVKTPLVKFALDIIKETNLKMNVLKYVGGKSGYNVKIRELLQYCGINRLCPKLNEDTSDIEYVPLFELGSSKLARKTHVDMMNKVQINLYVTGLHKKGSQAVRHYTSMTLQDRFKLMCAAFSQPIYKVDKDLNEIQC